MPGSRDLHVHVNDHSLYVTLRTMKREQSKCQNMLRYIIIVEFQSVFLCEENATRLALISLFSC